MTHKPRERFFDASDLYPDCDSWGTDVRESIRANERFTDFDKEIASAKNAAIAAGDTSILIYPSPEFDPDFMAKLGAHFASIALSAETEELHDIDITKFSF